jgi:hypothetical protein
MLLMQDIVDYPEVTVFIRVGKVVTADVLLQVFVALNEPEVIQHRVFDSIKTRLNQ